VPLPVTAELWFVCQQDQECFFISIQQVLGSTHSPIKSVMGTVCSGIKQLVCEVDHLPPSSAKARSMWSYTSSTTYVLMARRETNLQDIRLAVPCS